MPNFVLNSKALAPVVTFVSKAFLYFRLSGRGSDHDHDHDHDPDHDPDHGLVDLDHDH